MAVNYSNSRDAQGELIAGGITGIVELLDDRTALKAPYPDDDVEDHILDIAKEASIYRRIGPHERFVRMLGHSREGLVLEYMKNGDLKTYIQEHHHSSISKNKKLKWAYQTDTNTTSQHETCIRKHQYLSTNKHKKVQKNL